MSERWRRKAVIDDVRMAGGTQASESCEFSELAEGDPETRSCDVGVENSTS
jgi:hypothetical protein